MNEKLRLILARITEMEDTLQEELYRASDQLQFRFHNGKVVFERELKARNKAFKTGLIAYIRNARLLVILTAPAIYLLIIPFVMLDIFVNFYQFVCFPVYGIPKVRRADYLVFDRLKLDYLNGIEKINCAFCSYGNGIVAYTQEIAARTEQYWCPIKHAQKVAAVHMHYPKFTDFGDGEQYRKQLGSIQRDFDS